MGLFGSKDRGEASTRTYRLREKLFSIGEDFWIEDRDGNKAYKVNGKALSMRDTFELESPGGQTLLKIQERKLTVRDTMAIERGGDAVAKVRKGMLGFRDRFTIDLASGGEIKVKGKVLDREYVFERDGKRVAQVSRKWFRMRDSYGVEVEPGEDAALILAAAVCIDRMREE